VIIYNSLINKISCNIYKYMKLFDRDVFTDSVSFICFIKEEQKKQQDTTLEQVCGGVADVPKVRLSTKKMLKGHINKVNSVHYSGDSRSVLTLVFILLRFVMSKCFLLLKCLYFFKYAFALNFNVSLDNLSYLKNLLVLFCNRCNKPVTLPLNFEL